MTRDREDNFYAGFAKSQSIGMMIASVTIKAQKKINEKPYSIQIHK